MAIIVYTLACCQPEAGVPRPCMCACVCACVHAYVCACVCACVRACVVVGVL